MEIVKLYYEDDWVTIYHGDCREILPDIPKVDLVLTDPPYGEAYASGWRGRFQGEEIPNDRDTSARDAFMDSWGGPAAVFGKWSVAKWGAPRGVLVWDKGPANGMGDLSFPWKPSWEDIAIYGDGWSGKRDPGVLRGPTMVSWSGRAGQRMHPNEKPVWLCRLLLEKAPEAHAILDPFMGSGTTLRAAKDLNRKAIGIEIEEKYAEIAANRMSQEVFDFSQKESS